MELGAFSISLNVKNLVASKEFYEKLGFHVLAGEIKGNYLIMKNGNAVIGLFQEMFDKNILTFNPGWDELGKELDSFTDIRVIQQTLKEQDIAIENEVDVESTGPGSFMIIDPDGNPILIDQHR